MNHPSGSTFRTTTDPRTAADFRTDTDLRTGHRSGTRHRAGAGGVWPELPELPELVAAECAAEAAASGEDPEELQQAVWLRWLESGGGGADGGARAAGRPAQSGPAVTSVPSVQAVPSARWVRGAVRAESRRARRRRNREAPLPEAGFAEEPSAEAVVLAAERWRLLAEAVAGLPGPCPEVLRTLFSGRDLTYAEAAGELGMSQGSLGPVRSRCLGCLRTMLAASDCGT